MRVLPLFCVLAVWIIPASEAVVFFLNVPPVFGNQNDPRTQEYYAEACRNCSLSDNGMYYSHDNACNMYIICIMMPPSNWMVYGFVAPRGAFFNEKSLQLENIFLQSQGQRIPNRGSCPRVGHPCDTGKMIPVDGDGCHGYQVCVNNQMVTRRCSNPRTAFNALTQTCDLPCNVRQRTLISERCEPNPTSRDYYYNYQTVKYADRADTIVEHFNLRCTLGYKYLDRTKCVCQPFNETAKPCETVSLVYLDSEDDSWRLARNNTPIMEGSSLTGNATMVMNSFTNFRYAPMFTGNRVLSAPKIRGNDLGLYFDMNFTFQSLQVNQISPGLTFQASGFSTADFALADNSACDIPATYGCKLQARTQNTGRVMCYVKPESVPDHTNNIVITSNNLDLTREIRVYFAKNDTTGLLSINEGGSETLTRFNFPKGVRAIGNACPLTIGAGSQKRYFNGYMFDLKVKKYCGPFL